MNKGVLVVVIAPSGSGKGTLVSHVRSVFPDISHTVSCTTRAMRPGEKEGVDYYFLSHEAFLERVDKHLFVEWAEYGGNLYGTLASEVETRLDKGECIILEIEVQGARAIRRLFPFNSVTIYIDAGSWEQLAERILARAPIDEMELSQRHAHYDDERAYKEEAMFVVHNENGHLPEAKREFEAIIRSIRENAIA